VKFRKKPVVIEAVQFDWDNAEEIMGWADASEPPCSMSALYVGEHTDAASGLLITTLEGEMRADCGDWIIRGVKGEFYPCKPDIFEATYEPVDD